jgi:ABC-type nickel/cobalt efflux system permease component RcnA
MFRRHAALLVALLLTSVATSACVVRSEPRHRHRHAPPPHHKHKHKHKKHKHHRDHRHHFENGPSRTWEDTSLRDASY